MNNLYSSPKKFYTHYITLLFYFNWIWRRSLKFAKFWPLGALPLGPHGGNMYHMNTFESPAPEDDSCQVWLKSNHAVTFYIGPPPQPVTPHGAIGATLGRATNNLYSSPRKVSTLYTTWLFYLNWIWRRKFEIWPLGGLPLGPHDGNMYHMITFESPAPKDDSCHVWLKSNHAFSKRRWNSYFLQRAHRGLLGPPWELPWTTFILHLIRYLHTI